VAISIHVPVSMNFHKLYVYVYACQVAIWAPVRCKFSQKEDWKGFFRVVPGSCHIVPGCLVHSYRFKHYWKHAPVARVSLIENSRQTANNWNWPTTDCSSFAVYLLV